MTLLVHLGLMATMSVGSAAPCPVRLVPADAPRSWVSAAAALERALHDTPRIDGDCRAVVVHAAIDEATGGASVEVTTADGRHGVRRLENTRDLEPAVTAMIVTLPSDVLEPPPAAPPTAASTTVSAMPAPLTPPLDRWRALVYAGGGGRLTLPSGSAPVVELMAGAVRHSWELALFGSWAPTVVGTVGTGGFSSSAELGISVARREAIGARSGGDLIVGVRTTAVGLWGHVIAGQSMMEGTGTGTFDDTPPATAFTLGPGLAAFLGTSLPLFSSFQLRPQLSFQWIPLGISTASTTQSSIWSIGLSLGAERRMP